MDINQIIQVQSGFLSFIAVTVYLLLEVIEYSILNTRKGK